jgi:phosphoglycolate phosphatase
MGRISGVLFDKDGTLFDFCKTWGAWARMFLLDLSRGDAGLAAIMGEAIGYDMTEERFSRTSPVIAGTPGEIAELLLPYLPGASPSSLISHMNVSAAEAPLAEAAPLQPILGQLRTRGLRLGVASNDSEVTTRAHLRTAGVCDLFDFVAGFDSGHGAKPQPGPLLAFAEAMRIAPENVVMVGDSRHDMVAGRAAGMVTVAVLTGLATAEELMPLADFVIDDISELPAWLEGAAQPAIEAA